MGWEFEADEDDEVVVAEKKTVHAAVQQPGDRARRLMGRSNQRKRFAADGRSFSKLNGMQGLTGMSSSYGAHDRSRASVLRVSGLLDKMEEGQSRGQSRTNSGPSSDGGSDGDQDPLLPALGISVTGHTEAPW